MCWWPCSTARDICLIANIKSLRCSVSVLDRLPVRPLWSPTLPPRPLTRKLSPPFRWPRESIACDAGEWRWDEFVIISWKIHELILRFLSGSITTADRAVRDQEEAVRIQVDWDSPDPRVARARQAAQLIPRAASSHVTRSFTSGRSMTLPTASIRPFICPASIPATIVAPCPGR